MEKNKKNEYTFNEVPIGLSFALSFNQNAFYNFGNLEEQEKRNVINYIKNSKDSKEGEKRTYEVVSRLEMGDKKF